MTANSVDFAVAERDHFVRVRQVFSTPVEQDENFNHVEVGVDANKPDSRKQEYHISTGYCSTLTQQGDQDERVEQSRGSVPSKGKD